MDYLPHVLAIFFAVGAVMSSERIDAPPRGEIVALRALADGTALVAWRGHAADFITHVRRDGTLLSAEISRERVELEPFASLDVLPEECSGHPCGTYHGKRVVELMSSISIGGVEYKLPLTDWPSVVLPGRLRMLQGELPQLIGLDTADGPIVLDLETHAIVWREDSDDRFLRDGSDLYLVSDDRVRVFD
ncbi:MAG: hypothetical protein JO257_30405, partial [Deltaproteobacteria bacterium]|nr:hypothetical protein [Deltaproteobacteria bacterium]